MVICASWTESATTPQCECNLFFGLRHTSTFYIQKITTSQENNTYQMINKRPHMSFHVVTVVLSGCHWTTLSDPHPVSNKIRVYQFVQRLVFLLMIDIRIITSCPVCEHQPDLFYIATLVRWFRGCIGDSDLVSAARFQMSPSPRERPWARIRTAESYHETCPHVTV